jgi:hypothetical protein
MILAVIADYEYMVPVSVFLFIILIGHATLVMGWNVELAVTR